MIDGTSRQLVGKRILQTIRIGLITRRKIDDAARRFLNVGGLFTISRNCRKLRACNDARRAIGDGVIGSKNEGRDVKAAGQ